MSRKVTLTVYLEPEQVQALRALVDASQPLVGTVTVADYIRAGIDLVLERERDAPPFDPREDKRTTESGG